MSPSHPPVTTYFIVDNLHCPTCVSAIKDTLGNIEGVEWVSPNIVTSWVAIEHDPKVTPSEMYSKLESAGFDISGVGSTNGEVSLADLRRGDHSDGLHRSDTHYSLDLGERLTPWGRMIKLSDKLSEKILPKKSSTSEADKERKEKEHLKNCEKCRTKASNPPAPDTLPSGTASNQRDGQSEDQQVDDEKSTEGLVTSTQPIGNEDDEKSESPDNVGHRWRVSMTISDLVCSSCVATLTDLLKPRQWITKISIDYISDSGVFEYIGTKEDAKQIAEAIEDTGRDTEIVQITNIDRGNNVSSERTVRIRIDGFYCEHCADRATNSLRGLPRDLKIEKRPTCEQPILKITYTPAGPKFTIRQILSVIEASDPAFKASIFHLPTLEERSKKLRAAERKKIAIRAWFTTAVVIPTFIIGVVYMSLVPDHNPSKMLLMEAWRPGISRAQFSLCIMATPVYFFSANLFHRRAILEIKALWMRRPRSDGLRYMDDDETSGALKTKEFLQRFYRFGSMDMLVSLGTTIAYVSSISQMIAAAVDRPAMVNDANFYFDSVVFLTFFLLWGRFIEKYSESKLGDAVDALTKLRPTTAKLIEKITDTNEKEKEVSIDMLDVGDIIRIPNGASPPCDGKIVSGETSFDESSLTGESFPVSKAANDDVFAGTVNMDRPVLVQITGTAGQSMLDQIVAIVREGQAKPSQIQDLATRLTKYFVPFITLIAIITWLVWLVLGLSGAIPGHFLDVSSGGWVVFSLQFAIAVFVVACPCGLGLAAPTAIFAGSGLAAKYGILAKGGGHAFEKASRIDCVVFDKTGTLTIGGQPMITDSTTFPDCEISEQQRNTFLGALRAVEDNSSHPIAKAVVSWCASQTLERVEVAGVQEMPGKGLKATYKAGSPPQSYDIVVGNEALMDDFMIDISLGVATSLQTWKKEGKSIALAAIKAADKPDTYRIAAALAITDPIRRETPAVIRALQSAGKDVWMLSGDNPTTAKAVALRIGIPDLNVIAGVLPTEKHEKIKWLQQTLKARKGNVELTNRRAFVAMVGDGINDTAALSTADVGVAIGSGSDVAISSADFVLVNSNLESIVTLLDLSRAVFRRIKFNFAWALVYNVVAVPIAAGCLYALTVGGQHVRLPPVWASLAMALSSISVVTSSLALRSGIPGLGFRVRKVFVARDGEVRKGGVYGFGGVKA
ncbi:heavy metal translocatin [Annulohypoxylon truncatum]|uniref:heavy metal translocatin n=1 Tax=Annulohypoxylon truncatum TaxID=327061 RepID=UPI002007CF79|nr:heavy metal translocatin [Annulohypoxylon truncatum]KAI1211435.1 heavy metal translocatin [Annulohypoxylon truncatum]